MKNILKILILFLLFAFGTSLQTFASEKETYDEIYERLAPADFEYIFGIDPYQAEDYTKYMYSPYPLFRVGVPFIFKDIKIEPGYYILTPRKKNGKTYVLFKEQGRVKYLIPVYEIYLVDPLFYDQYIPEKRKGFWEKAGEKTSNFFGRLFPQKTQRMPAPKAYIEVNDIDREYFQVILFYGTQKYYMLFRQR